ncbi:hypothetical protein BGZ57DRAFT_150587 [Hyaloscypha finlandica]|nr:hypothetical protein BGZ57DRAFT_150587 [Hyaloscypha finlandica]
MPLLERALRRCRITSNFLVNKLHAEGDLPSHAEQVTQTFQVFVNLLPIDLQLLASFRQAASTAFLDRDFDNRFFARIFIFWEFVLVLEIVIKSGVELSRYMVEALVSGCGKGVLHYWVRWAETLEPEHSLGDAKEMVDKFEARLSVKREVKKLKKGPGSKPLARSKRHRTRSRVENASKLPVADQKSCKMFLDMAQLRALRSGRRREA